MLAACQPSATPRVDRITRLSSGTIAAESGFGQDSARTLRWQLGTLDPRFDLTDDQFAQAIERAAALWESEAGQELFERDESLGFPVNLVYDHRQAHVLASRASEEELRQSKSALQQLEQTRKSAEREFHRAKAQYEAARVDYESRLHAYNRQVAAVNAAGGANEYQAAHLDSERSRLASERFQLDEARLSVQDLQSRANGIVQQYNEAVRLNNARVRNHNQRFAGVLQTIGECIRSDRRVKEINIYAFESPDHLAIVLAHEMGHALGLGHVAGAGAIMSEVEGGAEGSETLKLTERDRGELQRALVEFNSPPR